MTTPRPAAATSPTRSDTGGSAHPTVVLLFIAVVVGAEAVVAFVDPVAGAAMHGVLLLALLLRFLIAGELAVLCLGLLPLARLASLALTPGYDGAVAYALTGLPLLLAVPWVFFGQPDVRPGLRTPVNVATVTVALSGAPIGALAYAVLDLPVLPAASAPLTLLVEATAVFVFAGVLEEWLFRGILQPALEGVFGGWSVVLTSVLYAAAYLPSHDVAVIGVTAALGAAAGWYVRRTRLLVPVMVAHGLAAAGALVVWPGLT
jgi:membrane protease YdiL (CAAX protease family)